MMKKSLLLALLLPSLAHADSFEIRRTLQPGQGTRVMNWGEREESRFKFTVSDEIIVDSKDFKSAVADPRGGFFKTKEMKDEYAQVILTLTEEGAKKLIAATRETQTIDVKSMPTDAPRLVIIVDGKIIDAPYVMPYTSGVIKLTGIVDMPAAEALAAELTKAAEK